MLVNLGPPTLENMEEQIGSYSSTSSRHFSFIMFRNEFFQMAKNLFDVSDFFTILHVKNYTTIYIILSCNVRVSCLLKLFVLFERTTNTDSRSIIERIDGMYTMLQIRPHNRHRSAQIHGQSRTTFILLKNSLYCFELKNTLSVSRWILLPKRLGAEIMNISLCI